jgi:hypothetical protein
MFNPGFDDLFFTSQFISGLKDELRGAVHAQLPDSVDKASMLAKLQQQVLDRPKFRVNRGNTPKAGTSAAKGDVAQTPNNTLLWKERQLSDYRRSNDLCYYCGDKFEPNHLHKCPKRAKPQVNALVINDLNVELTDDTLNQLKAEDILTAELGQLSLNAMSGTEFGDSMRISALVHNKVMLILVDSGSSHNFVSSAFLLQTGISSQPVAPMHVRVANGEVLSSAHQVKELEWWAQGFTFHTTMRVLDIGAYDAILGYDWLSAHNPMVCHWDKKVLQF